MAIPTNFQGYTPVAGTTKSFKILGSATVGVWGNDVDGTFAPLIVPLAPNLVIFAGKAYAEADIIAAVLSYLQDSGVVFVGAGGYVAQPAAQIALTSTTCT